MKNYLNNAGAGIMSSRTLKAVIDHLKLEQKIGAYEAAKQAKPVIENFYTLAAKLINASSPREIAFVDSASRGWNMAIYGVEMNKGDRILTLSSEFGTNLVTLFDIAMKARAEIKVIECDKETGDFSMSELENELKKGVKFVAISHAIAHGSVVNPVKEIGRLSRKYGAIYIVDGCQTVGQMDVDVQSINCDVYITTGRKWLCGPRGTGFLYVRESSQIKTTQLDLASADLVLDNSFNVIGLDIRSDAKRFELWERSVASMIGFSSAIEELLEKDIENIASRIIILANKIRKKVAEHPQLNLIGAPESDSGIVGFYLANPSKEKDVLSKFESSKLGVISTMSDWDCPLHFPRNGAKSIFRLSPHYYTEISTVNLACKIISQL